MKVIIEIFLPVHINGEKTDYLVSNYGLVKSLIKNKILKPEIRSGYYSVNIYHNGCRYKKTIHRLMALEFISNPENKPEVNHKDGFKLNNELTNLEWSTKSENAIHAFKMKLRRNKKGEESHLCKFSNSLIIKACEMLSNRYSPFEITNETGLSDKVIHLIYKKKIRYEITKNYNFPINIFNHSKVFSLDFRLKVKNLILKGYNNSEICKYLNIENTKQIQDLTYRIKKRGVEKGSTTIL